MTSFHYFAPQTIQSAFDLLDQFGVDARLLAGGTDLLVRIRSGRIAPRVVIDLKRIGEISSHVDVRADEVEIGALTLMAELQYHEIIRQHFPALVDAASSVGSVQIRNRATLAGNICNASPAADTAPALLIYGARVKVASKTHIRLLALQDFLLGPGKTALQPGELVTALLLPIPQERQAAVFDRLTRRKGVDLATINVCCQVSASGVTRVAVGAAGPVPFVVPDPSGRLADPTASKTARTQILDVMMQQATPIGDVRASLAYRRAMLVVLAGRAIEKALARLNS